MLAALEDLDDYSERPPPTHFNGPRAGRARSDQLKTETPGATANGSQSSMASSESSSSSSASEQDMEVIWTTYKRAAGVAHPDKGGSHDAMTELNAALAAAEKELGAK